MKNITETHLNAVENTLQGLLDEIKAENYTTISEVLGSVHSSLSAVRGLKKERLSEKLESGDYE